MAGSTDWLGSLRSAARSRFEAGEDAWELDAEAWKYTRISEYLPQAALLEKTDRAACSLPDGASAGVPLEDSMTQGGARQAALKERLAKINHPLADLNLSRLEQGLVILGECETSSRFNIEFSSMNVEFSSRRLLIHAPAHSRLRVVESGAAAADMHNLVVQVRLDEGASLRHFRLSGAHGRSWTLIDAHLAKHASYELACLVCGPQRERIECRLNLEGEGARLETRHLLLGQEAEHSDLQLGIRHAAANTRSRHLVKTLAADRSRLTVRGRIHIEPECPGTDADLTIRNLMLGDACRINAKPELEIYTDDVACSHGTTFAELDAEQLFYLSSRGIPKHSAQELLLKAFAADCLFQDEDLHDLNGAALDRVEALAA